MNTKYLIKDGIMCFNWDFDEPFDDYTDIMKNCSQIIFSNYDNYELCIKTKNRYDLKCYKNYKGNKFNQPLTNSLNQL